LILVFPDEFVAENLVFIVSLPVVFEK